jgi:solute carrier family 25, member 38
MPSLARYASFTFPRNFLLIDHFLESNVPGVAMYMTSLTQLRTLMAQSPYFAHIKKSPDGAGTNCNGSVLPSLTSQGNLLAGATTRVTVGFVLNPFSVLKARFEVRLASVIRFCCR